MALMKQEIKNQTATDSNKLQTETHIQATQNQVSGGKVSICEALGLETKAEVGPLFRVH